MSKTLKKTLKRVNKSKEEIKSDFLQQEKIAHLKEVVTGMFPIVQSAGTIYDGQTVVNALAGFIEPHIEEAVRKIKLSDLPIISYLEKEEDTPIKQAIIKIIDMFKDEPAQELSETLEKFGRALGQYSANEFMKQNMSVMNIKDIVA